MQGGKGAGTGCGGKEPVCPKAWISYTLGKVILGASRLSGKA